MFERYTERARKVVTLADVRAGGATMTTGHLLLGLLAEGGGLAWRVLTDLDVTADHAACASCGIASREPGAVSRDLPAPVSRNRLVSRSLRQVFEYAVREALSLGHNYVGTEHLLLALLRAEDGDGVAVLAALGVTADDLRHAVIRHLQGEPEAEAAEAEAPAEQRTYEIWAHCRNCRQWGRATLPFGTPVSEHPCKHCGVKALEHRP